MEKSNQTKLYKILRTQKLAIALALLFQTTTGCMIVQATGSGPATNGNQSSTSNNSGNSSTNNPAGSGSPRTPASVASSTPSPRPSASPSPIPSVSPSPSPSPSPSHSPTPTPSLAGATLFDSTNSYYRLGTSGSNLELSADWTPAWSNIVIYWKLNESSGTTVADSSPAGTNTGNLPGTGVTLGQVGKLGNAATFSDVSTNDIITGPTFESAVASPSFSFSAWIYPTATQYDAPTEAGGQLFRIGSTAPLWISGQSVRSYTTNWCDGITGNVSTSSWHHVALVSNNGVITTYADGTPVATCDMHYISSGWGAPSGTIQLGGILGGNRNFAGTVDEVAIWNTALSPSAVNTIYQHQSAKYSGTITSVIQNALSSVSWSSLSWLPTLPFFKALPDAGVSETAANYTGFASPTPTPTPLMSGNVGLWHLNESSGSSSLTDSSPLGTNTLNFISNCSFGADGKFGEALSCTGSNYGRLYANGGTTLTTAISLAGWIKPLTSTGNTNSLVFGPRNDSQLWLVNNTDLYYGTGGAGPLSCGVTGVLPSAFSWYHVALVRTGSTTNIYVNGKLQTLSSSSGCGTYSSTTSDVVMGATVNGGYGTGFNGLFDEVAIWSRALSATEVLQLYRRGANRMMFQVRSCSDASCTSGSPGWLGPDGTSQTYFSELYNTSNNALTSAVQAVLPTMTFTNAVFSALGLSTNQYFQYRSIMESDDGNTLCDYGAGATACSPELISVTPTHL